MKEFNWHIIQNRNRIWYSRLRSNWQLWKGEQQDFVLDCARTDGSLIMRKYTAYSTVLELTALKRWTKGFLSQLRASSQSLKKINKFYLNVPSSAVERYLIGTIFKTEIGYGVLDCARTESSDLIHTYIEFSTALELTSPLWWANALRSRHSLSWAESKGSNWQFRQGVISGWIFFNSQFQRR